MKTQTPNITITIDEFPSTIPTITLEVSTQTNLNFPDEKKYIDILRAMLIPSHKFVSIIPCKKDEKGRPIFFYINKYSDENSTEISIVKIRYYTECYYTNLIGTLSKKSVILTTLIYTILWRLTRIRLMKVAVIYNGNIHIELSKLTKQFILFFFFNLLFFITWFIVIRIFGQIY